MKKKIIWTIAIVFLSLTRSNGQWESISNDSMSRLKQKLSVLKDDSTRAKVLLNISSDYIYNIDSGLSYSFKANELSRRVNYRQGELQSLLQIEVILSHTGDTVRAFSTAHRGLKLAIQYRDRYYQAQFLGELGILLGGSINFDDALNYLRQSKALYDSIHEPAYSAYMDNNIGEVYYNKGLIDSALFYCTACYNTNVPNIYSWIKYYSLVNLGKINLVKTNYREALYYFRKALPIALFYSHLFNCNLYIAKTYFYLNERDSCLLYANEAMKIATESRINSQLVEANAFFASIYEKSDPAKALVYNSTALNYKDSSALYNEKLAIEQLAEFDEQERQYEIESSQASYRNKVKTYTFVSSAFVLVVIALILYRNNRHKQKINKALEAALSNLKSTQTQLIQSEKMASLGELTAGIAHEIQNPLNFVNNFSDVNKELLFELKEEADKRNIEEVKAIANDVIDNSEKINHHGKRADAIVKGMLEHSRPSTGKKELTDINKLANEYLRLAYHGFRAKERDFNAEIKTDFDNSIGKINIIPQDIGRVLLNLFNNAFYAVNEKTKKPTANDYQPTAEVKTRRINDRVEIIVRDNGNGIPEKIKEKIFQPFFTTKPTGQGTGLGLSLSYDIVKAHGGEIIVETRESEGSEFIIQLPILKNPA